MKRKIVILIALILVLTVPALSFAGSNDVKWDSYLRPGNFIASAGVGWGYASYGYWNGGFGVYGGAELIVAQYKVADVVPLEFGIAAKASLTFGYGGMGLNGGALGTAHLSFKGLDLPFSYLDNLDAYLGLGLGLSLDMSVYATPHFPVGFASITGASYFITDNIAIYGEEGYFANFWASSLGILLKL